MRNAVLLLLSLSMMAPAQTQQQDSVPIYRMQVTSRTVKAVNYRQGSTKIDFKGTSYLPFVKGDASVENKGGRVAVQVKLEKMEPAAKFGAPYMTYVLWAISPDGKPQNLGPMIVEGDRARLSATTGYAVFALIVTAEPYFAVTIPSELVVAENEVRQDTKGKVSMVDAKFELFQRSYWEAGKFTPITIDDPKTPFEYYEAKNAMRIAEWQGAAKYAPEALDKAKGELNQADVYRSRKGNNEKPIAMVSKEATQRAEDARVLAIRRQDEERLANERKAAADREAAEKAARENAEAQRKAEEEARKQAELAKLQESNRRLEAEAEAARAAAAKAAADAQTRDANEAARRAAEAAEKAELEKKQLRQSLLDRFNQILETRDTPRGLVVNMADVLFDTGKFNLRPEAREKLARFSGIVLAYPSLQFEVEGHTDSVGGDEYNQTLSEKRAESVRSFLVDNGLDASKINSRGFGKTMPVADNGTAQGRQKNRRVEIIVSGEVIGHQLTPGASQR